MMRSRYSAPQLAIKAARAALALAAARITLRTITPADVLARNAAVSRDTARRNPAPDSATTARICDEAAFFINRMAARVPWRSDCLVQALAGQGWLAQAGLASEIVVGTAKQADGSFHSHAWLRCGERIVLGGDITGFNPLLEPEAS